MTAGKDDEPPPKGPAIKRESMSCSVREHAWKLTGVVLFKINGFGSETITRLLSEVGVDISAFPTEKHFAIWLCLSPKRKVSGGSVRSSRTKASHNRAAAALRQAAVSVQRSYSGLGGYFRRMKSRKGPASAVTATALKIARIYSSLLKNGGEYYEGGARSYGGKSKSVPGNSLQFISGNSR